QGGGEVRFDWQPGGLVCTLSLAYAAASEPNKKNMSRNIPEYLRLITPAAKRPHVLLVEDEALVGMLIRDFLEEIGCTVTGPISELDQALQSARSDTFDAAVLDVNLGGSFAYPIAELLHTRGVPFVFLTGYAEDSLDERFAGTPTLRKPIERETLEAALQTALANTPRAHLLRAHP